MERTLLAFFLDPCLFFSPEPISIVNRWYRNALLINTRARRMRFAH